MRHHSQLASSLPQRQARYRNAVAKARTARRGARASKRSRGGQRNLQLPFSPPEDWHEPQNRAADEYAVIVQEPGEGYRHILAPREIRARLAELPARFVRDLEVVQLSRMTRKKQSFPCYGMQWGNALYLYPLEDSLTEFFPTPPGPDLVNETKMYGGRWKREGREGWTLVWTEETIKDYYLNNILIHELGHLLDDRNASYLDRERYAEWFAIEYGYRASRRGRAKKKKIVRRHHAV
jgi:hypothetical protein